MQSKKVKVDVKSITTKFGTARIQDGYWTISSKKEGNNSKRLHRLIYEDYYKISLLPNGVIHHKDGNKLNNRVDNLELMTVSEHMRFHALNRSVETKEKISKTQNKKAINTSKNRTSTGFFRVSKNKRNDVNNRYVWKYSYPNGTPIGSVDLKDLEIKVKEKGLKWVIVDESKAKKSMEENNASLPKYSHGGKHSYNYIPYAVIIKGGYRNGKWNYRIRYKSKVIKQSIHPNKLVKWFTKEYPNVILHLRIYEEMFKTIHGE